MADHQSAVMSARLVLTGLLLLSGISFLSALALGSVTLHWQDLWAVLQGEQGPECQRIVWLSASAFGDQGEGFKRQIKPSLSQSWRLGIERQGIASYASIYQEWCDDAQTCE